MTQREGELMRGLVAAQAALWDVIDAPRGPGAMAARTMLGILMARTMELTEEITREMEERR